MFINEVIKAAREYRVVQGRSPHGAQKAIARGLGVSPATMRSWQRRQKVPQVWIRMMAAEARAGGYGGTVDGIAAYYIDHPFKRV